MAINDIKSHNLAQKAYGSSTHITRKATILENRDEEYSINKSAYLQEAGIWDHQHSTRLPPFWSCVTSAIYELPKTQRKVAHKVSVWADGPRVSHAAANVWVCAHLVLVWIRCSLFVIRWELPCEDSHDHLALGTAGPEHEGHQGSCVENECCCPHS